MTKKSNFNKFLDSILNESLADAIYWENAMSGKDPHSGLPQDIEAKIRKYRQSLIDEYKNKAKKKQPETFYPSSKLKKFVRQGIIETKEYAMGNEPIEQSKEWLEAAFDHISQYIDDEFEVTDDELKQTIWILLGKLEEI